ncbi:MAG TPA: alpha/beta hydrolase [Aggregatilineales bacterium]|nr:alpha/beta hydrolase [Aggregatilineales bacterium]
MDFLQLIDPELVADFEQRPDDLFTAMVVENLAATRLDWGRGKPADSEILPPTQVQITERTIPGPYGDVPIVIYQPNVEAPRPAMLSLHAGAYVLGSPRDGAGQIPVAEYAGCTVVYVDYRLAPEHPFPAGAEDSFAALLWMAEHAGELGIDSKRIAVGGHSAGAGMAAAVALMNRDRNGPDLIFQWLTAPMLDNRHDTPSGHSLTHRKAYNRDVSLRAWKMYLGDSFDGDVSPYAAPARATDLSGLPPAYLTVGTMDLFRDETIEYAQRLMAAGVPTELAVYPGVFHSAEYAVPTASICQRMRKDYLDALKRALMAAETHPKANISR